MDDLNTVRTWEEKRNERLTQRSTCGRGGLEIWRRYHLDDLDLYSCFLDAREMLRPMNTKSGANGSAYLYQYKIDGKNGVRGVW